MHRAIKACVVLPVLLVGCRDRTQGDAVRASYDKTADSIDAAAQNQPTPVARGLYHDQAEAYREEGKDREKGLEGGTPSAGPKSGDASATKP